MGVRVWNLFAATGSAISRRRTAASTRSVTVWVGCADAAGMPGMRVTARPAVTAATAPRMFMVARAGIEPATFRFSGGRSYQLSYLAGRPSAHADEPRQYGDPDGTRTRDLRRDRAAR